MFLSSAVRCLPVLLLGIAGLTSVVGPAALASLVLTAGVTLARAETIRVGPTREYRRPSEAASVAQDGDVVEIDAGRYPGDVAVWRQNRLTIRGKGGRARLEAFGQSAEGKAIWVIKGDDVTVESIEFSGAIVPHKNGAGIRAEGRNLTIRDSVFRGNEMGLMSSNGIEGDIVIEFSEFHGNSVDYKKFGRLGHNIYIGTIRSFTLRGSYVHGAMTGHNVKTRARTNRILYNRIMDEDEAGSSYLVDLAEGGDAYLIGNLFHQSALSDNIAMIAYAAEGGRENAASRVFAVNNTFVNELETGVPLLNYGKAPVNMINNIFTGSDLLAEGLVRLAGNWAGENPLFVDAAAYDYRLRAGSPAIDRGEDPAGLGMRQPAAEFEYLHPLRLRPRATRSAIDAGAYEFDGP